MDHKLISQQAIRQVLRDYWHQYKAKPWHTVIGFSLPALGSVLVFFVPPLILAKLVDIFVARGEISLHSVGWLLVLFGALWILGEIFWRIGEHFLIRIKSRGIYRLAMTAFCRLTDRDYNFYTNNFVGSLTKKGIAFTSSFERFTEILSFNIITSIFPVIFAVIVLWRYSMWIPIILVGSIALALAVAIPIIHRRAKYVALRHDASSRVSGRLSDAITNMLVVKAFAKESFERTTYSKHVEDFTQKIQKAADVQNLRLNVAMSPMYVVTNVIGLIAAILFANTLGLQAGAIIVVFSYYSLVTRIFWEINNVYRGIESTVTEAAEFTQLFIEPPLVQDVPHTKKLSITNSSINFKDVHFQYEDGGNNDNTFLDSFNLDIKPNQKVGLVGPSGGGKTTIIKLLLRFIDIQGGAISIDDQNIKEVSQESLRRAIAYVPQEPLLFHRSLLENIAYGNEKATKAEVIKAAQMAHAHEFIVHLPHGYETLVGERGIKLSGGQRQRIVIARALLKSSKILVLDEATSSLDSESEKYIQEGLFELMKDKTALVIAHRFSTIKHLDRIIVLDAGTIVQDGTHAELIKQKGLYATLWGHQSGEFLED